MSNENAEALIEVRDLHVAFHTPSRRIQAVNGIDLDVRSGETMAIVGESGSGKSVTALAMLGAVRPPGRVEAGSVGYRGHDLFTMTEAERTALRGDRISMVFQDPMNSLDPVMKVGAQLEETIRNKTRQDGSTPHRSQVRERALDLMRLVGIPDPSRRFHDYPLAFSGGMRQRIMIALAMCNQPEVLVADEPTTALDVTIQAQVLEVFTQLNAEFGTAVVLVTHNFGVVAELCNRVAVMYGGQIVEQHTVPEVFEHARHPYTTALINSVPRMDSDITHALPGIEGMPPDPARLPAGCPFHPRCPRAVEVCTQHMPPLEPLDPAAAPQAATACWNPVPEGEILHRRLSPRPVVPNSADSDPDTSATADDVPILAGHQLVKHHHLGRSLLRPRNQSKVVRAVDGVDVEVQRGESLGIVGESGCGKSSLARLLVRADDPTTGEVALSGQDVTALSKRRLGDFRRTVQMIFQDPLASLSPRMTIAGLLEEPLIVHGLESNRQARRKRAVELLESVGLDGQILDRYPRQFSGGQLQRIAIARALAVSPRVLLCDEPVSALDVSLQAQVINLLDQLRVERDLTYVFISHDVALVRYFTDRMAVMYLGEVVELGSTQEVLDQPLHPYTRGLIESVPEPSATSKHRTKALAGDLPSPVDPPQACRFHTRCPIGPMVRDDRERCRTETPRLREVRPGRLSACHFAEELLAQDNASTDPNEPQTRSNNGQ